MAKASLFTWTGAFRNRQTEKVYRQESWPELMAGVGRMGALVSTGFLIMGYPLFSRGETLELLWPLIFLRVVVAGIGFLPLDRKSVV